MFTKELFALLLQVISSWQVILVSLAIILYFSLVSFVARTRRRSVYPAPPTVGQKNKKIVKTARATPKATPRATPRAGPKAGPTIEPEEEDDENANDELGLEEG